MDQNSYRNAAAAAVVRAAVEAALATVEGTTVVGGLGIGGRTPAKLELERIRAEDATAIGDLVDAGLRGDAFIPRRQMVEICSRPSSQVYAIKWEGELAGVAIVYEGSLLHNLFLMPWARGKGIGSEVIRRLDPKQIRAKTNMSTGDPTPFYTAAGYTEKGKAEGKPHIAVLEKSEKTMTAELKGAGERTPSENEELARMYLEKKEKERKRSRESNRRKRAEKKAAAAAEVEKVTGKAPSGNGQVLFSRTSIEK